MQARSFYITDPSVDFIPLVIITKTQWPTEYELLPAQERACLDSEQFQGKVGQYSLIHSSEGRLVKVYVGGGENSDVDAIAYAATVLPVEHVYQAQHELSFQAQLIWSSAQYRYDRYKKPARQPCRLFLAEALFPALIAEADMVFFIRDLINAPTNDLGPHQLDEVTAKLAQMYNAEYETWVGDQLLQSNFPAIHAVGRASSSAPRLLSLTWGDPAHPHITLVGKGVCFDSGGLDIKPAQAMRIMKKDMGGAAHALGLAQWIMATRLPVRLNVLIPAVENAIGSDAFRPGDILTMRNGLSVEIDNTDAEGRLVLADALVKACEGPIDLLIDFATLTGAARVAVGTELAAVFTPDDGLAMDLQASSNTVNDPIWRLPLYQGYQSMLDSPVADLQNSSPSSYAGAIVAALFLERFVTKTTPWIHFDIMAWNVSSKAGKPEGGEAMGVRALAHYLTQRYRMSM